MTVAVLQKDSELLSVSQQVDVAPTHHEFTLEWFKQELINAGVSALYIAWGNYKEEFFQVPHHLMRSYVHHRKYFLHRQALSLANAEYRAMEEHPFAI